VQEEAKKEFIRLREMGKYFEECFTELDQEASEVLWRLLERWKPYNELNSLVNEENKDLMRQNWVLEQEMKIMKSFSSEPSRKTTKQSGQVVNFAPNILKLQEDSEETALEKRMKQQREQLSKQLGL